MAKIYAELIRKGLKTLEDVPDNLRAAVEKILQLLRDEQGIREETERAQAENALLSE